MITDTFDDTSEPICTREAFLGPKKNVCDLAVVTLSPQIYHAVLNTYLNSEAAILAVSNMTRPIHLIDINGRKVIFYLSEMGSSLAAEDIIEVNWKTGATKFIMFGASGSLASDITTGKYVIPTEAYRDEGMSYHYAKASDFIKIKNSKWLISLFEKEGLPYVAGKVWTTDAFYRETKNIVAKRKEAGCIAVEMELAGVQAVCDFYGFELYDFLVTADTLDTPKYTKDGYDEASHSLDKFLISLKIIEALDGSN